MKQVNILVVDDDPGIRLALTKQLQKLGHTAESVQNGALAVQAVEKNGYALVLMDVGMPVLDGLQATQKIRAMEKMQNTKHHPIVALTGQSDKSKCLAAGMDEFLQKPALLDDLRKMIERFAPECDCCS